MALILNGDNGIVYNNLNQDIRSLLMPKNWIINGMFDVWQRGTNNTFNGSEGFVFPSVDRYALWTNSSTALNTSQRLEFDISDTAVPNNPKYYHRLVANSIAGGQVYIVMNHTIEDMRKLAGKTMTISFWIKSNNNSDAQVGWGNSVTDITGTQLFTTTNTWTKKTHTFTLQTVSGVNSSNSYTKIQFRFFTPSNGTTFDIANVSLVEGSVAVECQNQPYADVLRECQRYCRRFNSPSNYGLFGNGFASSTSICSVHIPISPPMRKVPILTFSGAFGVFDGATVFSASNITANANTTTEFVSYDVAVAGLTTLKNYQFVANNNISSYLELSAEL